MTKSAINILVLLLYMTACSSQQEGNWTHFRGSNLDGISSAKGLPVTWNDSLNIEWKTEIEGRGWSSPVVFGNQIWCTSASPDGKEMFAVCLDLQTGETIHRITVFEPDSIHRIHAVNSYATPTPCIEKDFVYLSYGSYGTACINTHTGQTLWKRNDLHCEHIQGPGSSLVLYKDLLIVHMEGSDQQYIVALDKKTGETVWKAERPAECYEHLEYIGKKAYTTPIIITVNGQDLMISNGAAVCIAYDPMTGKEIWRIVQGEDSTIAMPVESDGIIFFYTSFIAPPGGEKFIELLAVDPEGTGDITDTNILWRKKAPILQLLTPIVKDGLLYTVESDGTMFCINALSGEIIWSEDLKGKYHSSPLYADGYIYFNSVKGETLVIKEGRTFRVAAKNRLDGEIWATPAVADNSLLIRTSKYLYKIKSGETGKNNL